MSCWLLLIALSVVAMVVADRGGGGFGKRDELDQRHLDSGRRKREPDTNDRGKREQGDNGDKWWVDDDDKGKREIFSYKGAKREQASDDKGKREKSSLKREETDDEITHWRG